MSATGPDARGDLLVLHDSKKDGTLACGQPRYDRGGKEFDAGR
ncbi:hypothetical protein FP2506_15889 [Fulvimarina pelagi HTCC2506]|uniref:Uncharacterized protein n=1 Tax=Fulvimarina pelagi HTCC2506 TaxID=314231 RepID=Q0G3A2_9HYPH|nr:hypothetical protein FP2506_15889 [Fulvimarina pelagi HTCC2506]